MSPWCAPPFGRDSANFGGHAAHDKETNDEEGDELGVLGRRPTSGAPLARGRTSAAPSRGPAPPEDQGRVPSAAVIHHFAQALRQPTSTAHDCLRNLACHRRNGERKWRRGTSKSGRPTTGRRRRTTVVRVRIRPRSIEKKTPRRDAPPGPPLLLPGQRHRRKPAAPTPVRSLRCNGLTVKVRGPGLTP